MRNIWLEVRVVPLAMFLINLGLAGVPAPVSVQNQVLTDLGLDTIVLGSDTLALQNKLSVSEAEHGWKLLFNGNNLDEWHGQGSNTAPVGWSAINNELFTSKDAGFKHAFSNEEYDNFIWTVEWKITLEGNSGMFFRVQEFIGGNIEWHAPEMQIVDPDRWSGEFWWRDNKNGGGMYAMYWPTNGGDPVGELYFSNKTRDGAAGGPPEGWNRAIIIAHGNHVEFWLNGIKTVDFEMDSQDYNERWLGQGDRSGPQGNYTGLPSNWENQDQFNTQPKGVLMLQNWEHDVWFRNIKVKKLSSTPSGCDVWPLNPGVCIVRTLPGALSLNEISIRNFGEFLSIDIKVDEPHEIAILNLSGKIVKEFSGKGSQSYGISKSSLRGSGIYFIRINMRNITYSNKVSILSIN